MKDAPNQLTVQDVAKAVVFTMRIANEVYGKGWTFSAETVAEMCKALAMQRETEDARGAADS